MRILPKIELQPRHRKVLSMIKESKWRFVMAGLSMLAIAGTTAAFTYILKPIIDDIFMNKNTTGLALFPFLMIALFLLRGLGQYGQEYYMSYIGENIIRQLRNFLYERIQDLPIGFFQKERTGVLMSRITHDVGMVKSMVSTAVTASLRDVATVVGLTVVIFYQNWRLALISIVILPVAFYPIFELGRRTRKVSTGYQQAMGNLTAFLHETLAGNKIVKAFGMEKHETNRFFAMTQGLFRLEIKNILIRSLSSPIMEFLGGLAIAFTIWYGGWEVVNNKSTPGQFMSFLAAVMLLYDPIKKISRLNSTVQQGLAALDRVFDVIETEPDIKDPPSPLTIADTPHQIEFRDVWFSYGDKPVLKKINLEIDKGAVLALVGMSGGGKSTLVSLIPRFFDVIQGGIHIDDIDIRHLRVSDLRRQIAMVTQEPILFNETVRDNIAYGNTKAGEKEIIEAAKAAYAHDFIMDFPQGYDTLIGELGSRLSGGEKQRICIARALLKDAPILILDEATSALDTEAEVLVQKALENLMKGRTTLVIAHRLSTIAKADQIAVVVDGEIVEMGPHEALLNACGEYAKLYDMQFAGGRLMDRGELPKSFKNEEL